MSEIDTFLLLPMEAEDSFIPSIGHGQILCRGDPVVVFAIPIILTGESEPVSFAGAIFEPSRAGIPVGYLDRVRLVTCEMSPGFAMIALQKTVNIQLSILHGECL